MVLKRIDFTKDGVASERIFEGCQTIDKSLNGLYGLAQRMDPDGSQIKRACKLLQVVLTAKPGQPVNGDFDPDQKFFASMKHLNKQFEGGVSFEIATYVKEMREVFEDLTKQGTGGFEKMVFMTAEELLKCFAETFNDKPDAFHEHAEKLIATFSAKVSKIKVEAGKEVLAKTEELVAEES